MIWISRRKPPAVSPNASVSPVTIMMMTATIFATGPGTDSHTCCSGSSHGIPEPAAFAVAARAMPSMVAAAAVTILFGWRTRDRRMSFSLIVGGEVADGVVPIWIETGDARDRVHAAREATTGNEDDHVDGFGDQAPRDGDDAFLNQLFEPIECGDRAIGMDRRDAAWMPGVPAFKHVERTPHEIGRAHVCTPVTNAPIVCRLLLE